MLQVLQIDYNTREVCLLYLKEECSLRYSTTGETSWESWDVVINIEPEPTINAALSRRKIVYEFPVND